MVLQRLLRRRLGKGWPLTPPGTLIWLKTLSHINEFMKFVCADCVLWLFALCLFEHLSVVCELLFMALGGLFNDFSSVKHTPSVVNAPTIVLQGPMSMVLLLINLFFSCSTAVLRST